VTHDLFISYSRKDSSHALALAERLRASGIDVWIDQSGIEAATSWSGEIVRAIEAASALIVMLSPDSVASDNVVREVALAFDKKKKILPIELGEAFQVPHEMQYQLAGIQRAQLKDFDGIVRALVKLGIGGKDEGGRMKDEGKSSQLSSFIPHPSSLKMDDRKSLMILPFEDLSPTQDNGWFADGIVSEMVNALGNVKALRLIDWNTSKEFKTRKVATAVLAKELDVRYFLEGQVRKAGENIKVSVSLLDFETGDHLWQDSMKGTMNDVFDIQEQVAEKVVEGLKVHLASGEKKKLAERGTEHAEAYELFLKAGEYFLRQTRDGFLLTVQQLTLALELDPNYTDALIFKASVLAGLYRLYDRNADLLAEAEMLAKRALEIKSDGWRAYDSLSRVYLLQGRLAEAEVAAQEFVRRAPENSYSHATLGFFYSETGQHALAIAPYENALALKPDDLLGYFSLVISSDQSHDAARAEKWSRAALPLYERRLRLVPDDDGARVWYANLLRFAGKQAEAIETLAPLLDKQNLDGVSLYNIACLYARMGDTADALGALRRSVAAGFRNVELFYTDPDLDGLRGGSPTIREEFKTLLSELEIKSSES
jgi:TolB-like protein/Flp pilus assembly protein TadD